MADVLEFDELFYTAFEPKVQNRFIIGIDGIPSYMVRAAQRPSFAFNPIVLDHINLKRKLKGKIEWEDVTMTLYDPIVPSAAQAIMEWVRLSHEALTGRDGYAEFYKKDIDFWALGPVGDKVEQWKFKGAWISSFGGGSFDWGTDDPAEIEITITYDYGTNEY